MAKRFIHQVQFSTDAERSGTTPVQFLPSTMLSWRAPIIARRSVPAKPENKAFDDSLITQKGLCQPAS